MTDLTARDRLKGAEERLRAIEAYENCAVAVDPKDVADVLDELARLRHTMLVTAEACEKQDGFDAAEVLGLVAETGKRAREALKATTSVGDEGHGSIVRVTEEIMDENKLLRALVEELADDLQAEIQHTYAGTLDYPSQQRRYNRDMAVVRRAWRALGR
jgi:hypothetical protein